MLKRGFVIVLVLLLLVSLDSVSAISVNDEFKKLANYAGEYETGNIDYVQLLIYTSSIKGKMNEILGATGREIGGVLKQEQIKEILGEPVEDTKWVWSEGEEKETKLDNAVPVWKKIVFDGKKIQIRLNAWPSIFSKKEFKEDNENEKNKELEDLEGKLIYRLNFEIEFKKPEEQLNIQSKIDNIKTLAQSFNSDSSSENAEALAKESVNAERSFESYFRQGGGKCEDIMSSIFGTENKRQTQQLLVQEISFCEGDNFEIIARLEMCDNCEWNWINVDFRFEGRGPGFKPEKGEINMLSPKSFENMDFASFEGEIREIIDEIKQSCENKDFNAVMSAKNKLWPLNDAWNQKSNDVWKEIEQKNDVQGRTVVENKISEDKNQNNIIVENTGTSNSNTENIVENTITGNVITRRVIETGVATEEKNEQSEANNDPYFWIKQEQERRKQEKALRKQNYETRKQFYLNLFSGYDKKEYYFTQIEFQKRLVEEFKERGEEICDNNKDDNENEAIDCADDQCGGKICGKGKKVLGNETKETEVDFYCIEKECKAREEVVDIREEICGNHICGENETIESCAEDCSKCQTYPAINCSGRVIFSGTDENGCPLEPKCIEEKPCSINEDCKFLCGEGECVEGKCNVKELIGCKEPECVIGDKKILNCQTGEEIIVEECIDGLWKETGIKCEIKVEENCESYCMFQPHIMCVGHSDISGVYPSCNCGWVCGEEEPIAGNECSVREDCGGETDVCSNGRCVTIPEVIPVQPEEPEIIPSEEGEEITEEEATEGIAPSEPEPSTESEMQETAPEPTPESAPAEATEAQTTGGVIFAFFRTLFSKMRITGAAITGFGGGEEQQTPPAETAPEPPAEEPPLEEEPPETQPAPEQPTEECADKERGCGGPCPSCEEPTEDYREEDRDQERDDERRNEENKEENKERCKKDCKRPCIEKCIKDECGEKIECNVDEIQKKCEGTCEAEDDCVGKCMQGGDWWKEFENKDEHKEEKGVFQVGGSCRTSQGKTEGFIWFGGWGDPFEQIQPLKNKYYSGGQADWCKYDFENLKKQRQEFEKGFNQEFVKWFFEKYLANSAENWEQSVSGIFELYWKDVDNSREMAYRMQCLGIDELQNINLINVKYDTEYGSVEFWEEIKTVKLPGMDKEVQIISPYMKAWVFPPKSFIIYEMKQGMKNHEFPGSPEEKIERKNEEGLTSEEKQEIMEDKGQMKRIQKLSQKYGGNFDALVQFKDFETGEVVFNFYAQINEEDLINIKPMLPEEAPAEDARVEIDFKQIYEMIYTMEKEMRGAQIESPPWGRKLQPIQKVKQAVNKVKMWFKIRNIINSAKYYPADSEEDLKPFLKMFFMTMGGPEDGEPGKEELGEDNIKDIENNILESKEVITGEIILG